MLWEHRTGLFWPVVFVLFIYITENTTCIPHATETSVGSQLQFQSDLQITHMYSGEGEEVKLFLPVWPTGNVEDWLRDVEKSMKATLRDYIDRSLKVYPEVCDPDSHFDDVLSTLLSVVCTILRWGIFKLSCFCSLDSSATSCRVGVIVAWSSGDSWLSGLLDFWGVWGLGAGKFGQWPLSPTTDTGVDLVLDWSIFKLNNFLNSHNLWKSKHIHYVLLTFALSIVRSTIHWHS